MIRIDEIYDNVFSPHLKEGESIHYFTPFGSTDPLSLSVYPKLYNRNKSILMWDQEPYIHQTDKETIEYFDLLKIENLFSNFSTNFPEI